MAALLIDTSEIAKVDSERMSNYTWVMTSYDIKRLAETVTYADGWLEGMKTWEFTKAYLKAMNQQSNTSVEDCFFG